MNIFERNVPGMTNELRFARVGIAGCGGLGSNAAIALARAGVGYLDLIDFDQVELSNLNRQYFFRSDIGLQKVEALAAHLRNINPEIELFIHNRKLHPETVPEIFEESEILIEAFDDASAKLWLIRTWCALYPERPIICGNGIAGLGATDALKIMPAGNIYFCGDMKTEMDAGLCSARVAIVANMQANMAIELIMKWSDE